jgi:hypothetical protein
VVTPEECPRLGVQDVVLAMNTLYYPLAQARLARLGLISHLVLS